MTDYFFMIPISISIPASDIFFEVTDSQYNSKSLLAKRSFNYTSDSFSSKDTSDAEVAHSYSKNPSKKLKVDLSGILVFSDESLAEQKENLSQAVVKRGRGRPRKEQNDKGKGKKSASDKIKEANSKVLEKEFTRGRALSTDISVSDMVSVKSIDQGSSEKTVRLNGNTNGLLVDMLGEMGSDVNQLNKFLNNLRNDKAMEEESEQHNNINVDYKDLIATIPKFSLNNKLQRNGRRVLKPVWNPEVVDQDFLNEYSSMISESLNQVIINEEKSLELLKKCGMDAEKALEQVNKEKVYYRSHFGANQRQLRRKN